MTFYKIIKSSLLFLLFLALLLVAAIFWFTEQDRKTDYAVEFSGDVPEFDQQSINFVPSYDASETLPFTAGTVIDINNDGVEELFFGGGRHQQDAIYQYRSGMFRDITRQVGWHKETPDKTFAAIALDLDNDGDSDLLVARQSGVWLYTNAAGKFIARKLELDLDAKTVPLSIAVSDLNRDGLYDLYVAGYIAREYVEGETIFNRQYGGISALYINRGNHQFQNITREAGLYYQHNTFQAVFIDIDGDNLEDLVVAHDTGQVRTWKNQGDLRFTNMPNPTSDYFSYPMGIAVGDYNNDGNPDFFFSNVGSSVPEALVRGDLREDQTLNTKWMLLENQGDFKFVDVAEKTRLADYEFAWGAIFQDFNLDGKDDLVVSENYVGLPQHRLPAWRLDGRFMLQNQAGEFAAAGGMSGIQNRHYGISPLTADFNQDGYPDLVHVNLLGPQQVFFSRVGDKNFLKVGLPNNVSSIGAKVRVRLADGSTLYQTFVVGEGLCSDQSHILIFGLGRQAAQSVEVQYLDGQTARRQGRFVNELLAFPSEAESADSSIADQGTGDQE